jgi:hypothetical protein
MKLVALAALILGQGKPFDSRLAAPAQDKLAWRADYNAGLAEAKRAGKYLVVHFSGPN